MNNTYKNFVYKTNLVSNIQNVHRNLKSILGTYTQVMKIVCIFNMQMSKFLQVYLQKNKWLVYSQV